MSTIQSNWELRYRLPEETEEKVFGEEGRWLRLGAKKERCLRVTQLERICVIEAMGNIYQVEIYRGETIVGTLGSKELRVLQLGEIVRFRTIADNNLRPNTYMKLVQSNDTPAMPPGQSNDGYLLALLPEIYRSTARGHGGSEFIAQLLALLDHVLLPIRSSVDHADLYFTLGTTPASIYPWLSLFLPIFATPRGLERILRSIAKYDLNVQTTKAGFFTVTVHRDDYKQNANKLRRLIEACKPIGVDYELIENEGHQIDQTVIAS